jgi:hypothetical protein
MVNTDTLVDAWVTALQQVQPLVEALGGSQNIVGYKDRFPDQSNLRRAIVMQPPGSILVVYMGTDKVRAGNGGAWSFRHRFSFMVRAPEAREGGVSYAQIWSLFIDGVPLNSSVSLLHTEIDPACDAMDREGPSSARNSLLVSSDGETIDYFEFTATLIEKAA